jgi:ADP-ribose pyrophosphatase YjhB (NUDIX family)
VEHRPIILASAELMILESEDRILLQRRTDNGQWAIPGGIMEPGETFEETARRETREEVGLDLGELQFFTLLSGPDFYFKYPNGDEVYNVTAVYIARQFSGTLVSDGESSEFGFYPLDELPGPLVSLNQMVVDRYRQSLGV